MIISATNIQMHMSGALEGMFGVLEGMFGVNCLEIMLEALLC
jgi:hypothetical protein